MSDGRLVNRHAGVLILVAIATVACGSGGSSGAPSSSASATEPLTVVAGAAAPSLGLVWFAQLGGYFTKNNLDVTVKVVGGNVTTTLVADQADLGLNGATNAMAPVNNGISTSYIYTNGEGSIGGSAVGLPSVKSITDCSRMSVFTIGSTAYGYAVVEKNLYSAKYTIVQLGTAAQLAALRAGTVDCGIADESTWGSLLTDGTVHLLVDPRSVASLPQGFPTGIAGWGFWGIKLHLQERKGAIINFLKAMNQAWIDYQKLTSDQVAATLRQSPDFQAFGQASLAQSLTIIKPFLNPGSGYVNSTTWAANLNFFVKAGFGFINPSDSTWSYTSRVDMSYYDAAIGKPKGA